MIKTAEDYARALAINFGWARHPDAEAHLTEAMAEVMAEARRAALESPAVMAWRGLTREQQGFMWAVLNVTVGGYNCTDEMRHIVAVVRALLEATK